MVILKAKNQIALKILRIGRIWSRQKIRQKGDRQNEFSTRCYPSVIQSVIQATIWRTYECLRKNKKSEFSA
jgi:hypothetical protein